MKRGVRIYGHELGHTSFTQVTRGFLEAAIATETFAGFMPIDYWDEYEEYPGASAPVSVNCGAPSATAYAKALGEHDKKWLMLAPNSDRVPADMLEWVPKMVDGLLTPSRWAVDVLTKLFPGMPVRLAPHGIAADMKVNDPNRAEARRDYDAGEFRVVHFTSTNSDRKGTKTLLDAWRQFETKGMNLIVIVRYEGAAEVRKWIADRGLESARVLPSNGMEAQMTSLVYSWQHVVCQPSRAEGFGLVPLEARACGVPVVMTLCTGHSEHAIGAASTVLSGAPEPGIVPVLHGELEPLDDIPGSVAPAVTASAICEALSNARDNWRRLDEAAYLNAQAVQVVWSWPAKTGPVLLDLSKEAENE